LERGNAVRAGQRRSLSGNTAFTHGVRFNIPLTLRQALGANGMLNRSTAVFRFMHMRGLAPG
jgi:hypothetical protein